MKTQAKAEALRAPDWAARRQNLLLIMVFTAWAAMLGLPSALLLRALFG